MMRPAREPFQAPPPGARLTEVEGGSARRLRPDRVADEIWQRILLGAVRPGERLPPERQLADQLRVNRGSVREGLKKLEQLRLVSIQHGSGTRVCRLEEASFDLVQPAVLRAGVLNPRWFRDLLELREQVLGAVVRGAVERADAGERTQAAARLRETCATGLEPEDFARSWLELLDRLVRMSRNRVLGMLWQALADPLLTEPALAPVRARLFGSAPRLAPLLLRLAVAIEATDCDTAERTVRDLLRRVSELERLAVDG